MTGSSSMRRWRDCEILSSSPLRLRLDGEGRGRLRERDLGEDDGVGLVGQGVVGQGVLELGDGSQVPGPQLLHGRRRLPLQREEGAHALRRRPGSRCRRCRRPSAFPRRRARGRYGPAWGSTIVLNTKAERGAAGSAARSLLRRRTSGRSPFHAGRSTGDGRRSTMASRIGCMATFRADDAGRTGKRRRERTLCRSPLMRSGRGRFPSAKNSSMSVSSASATISTSWA